MARHKDDAVDIQDLICLHETERAYLIQSDFGPEVWIPKSQVEAVSWGETKKDAGGRTVRVMEWLTIKEWIAKKSGLI